MNSLSLLLAATLLLPGSLAYAEAAEKGDLRYCLDLPSDKEIAKCAGELSAGAKGQPFSREQVEKILAEEKADTAKPPVEAEKPAAPSGNP